MEEAETDERFDDRFFLCHLDPVISIDRRVELWLLLRARSGRKACQRMTTRRK